MQPSKETFLDLVRLAIGHRGNITSNQIDWQEIYELAIQQELLVVVIDGIERLSNILRPKQELMLEWSKKSFIKTEVNIKDNKNIIIL